MTMQDLVIRAPDGTWHRPMTGIREHIGNAVPPDAAEAIAVECMVALMSSADGGYHLSNGNIWVRPEMEWAA